MGGRDLSEYMQKILNDRGCKFTTFRQRETVRDIKEKLCYVPLDFEAELQKAVTSGECQTSYPLPNRDDLVLNSERFQCPELLFKPFLQGLEYDGLDRTTFDAIKRCDPNTRNELFANIVLCGGSSMFQGLSERLQKEISKLAPVGTNVRIVAQANRADAAWIGGSVLAAMPQFSQMLINRSEYNDRGPGIAHNKCF
jgi:actin